MQFSCSSTLSVVVLLFNFSIFTNASPLYGLTGRDLVCATDYRSCTAAAGTLYCCPPNTDCAPNDGCAATASTTTSDTTSTPSSTASPNASSTPPVTPKAKKKGVIFNETVIIAISAGGGVALLLLIIGSWACHRKRQQGRALLAAYESPDRAPYEAISLKTKRSTASFNTVPPAPATPVPGTPTTRAAFNIPQHTATPPPVYMNGDEKETFPRHPQQAFQKEMNTPRSASMSPSPLVTPSRTAFPVGVLGSPRSSSLPPYSPQRTGFTSQQVPFSPQQQTLSPQQATFSPQQVPFSTQQQTLSPQQATFSHYQAPFSPQQQALSPQQATFSPQQTGFSFTLQSENTSIHSPPRSPVTSTATEELFLPVDQHQPQPQHGYPMAY